MNITKHEKSCGAVVFTLLNGRIKYLMICEKRGSHWGFPKGHVEPGETEHETARREIFEETGLSVKFIDGFRMWDTYPLIREGHPEISKEVVYFAAEYENQDFKPQEAEISCIKLMDFNEAMAVLRFESQQKILAGANDFLSSVLRGINDER